MSHAAFWSVLMGREDCLDCRQAGSKACTKERVFTLGLIKEGNSRAGRINKTGKSDQKNRSQIPEVSFMKKYCLLFLVCVSFVNTDVLLFPRG